KGSEDRGVAGSDLCNGVAELVCDPDVCSVKDNRLRSIADAKRPGLCGGHLTAGRLPDDPESQPVDRQCQKDEQAALQKTSFHLRAPFSPSRALVFGGQSTNRIDSTIQLALASPGHAPQRSSASLPYRTIPMCCDLSASSLRSGLVKPSFRRSVSMSLASPVRNVQPGSTPCIFAYSFSAFGESCSGLSVIEYMKMSRPTRLPSAFWTFTRLAVMPGQTPSQSVNIMLMVTILSLTRSS